MGVKSEKLPVEQIAEFELLLNLETATALRPTVPPSLPLCADDIIK